MPQLAQTNNRDDAIRIIRAELRRRSGKPWSVTGGRGGAWGWITITAPPARRVRKLSNPAWHPSHECDEQHRGACRDIARFLDGPLQREGSMSEADLDELCELLSLGNRATHWQGVNIPASSEHYIEYVDRARGLAPGRVAQPYWD